MTRSHAARPSAQCGGLSAFTELCVHQQPASEHTRLPKKEAAPYAPSQPGDHHLRPASGSACPGHHAHGPILRGALRLAPSLSVVLQGLVRAEACVDTLLLFLLDDIAPSGRTVVPPSAWAAPTFWLHAGCTPPCGRGSGSLGRRPGRNCWALWQLVFDRLNRQAVFKQSRFEDKWKEAERCFYGSPATRPMSRGTGGTFHARTDKRGGLRTPREEMKRGEWLVSQAVAGSSGVGWPPHTGPAGPGGDPRRDPALSRLSGHLLRPCQASALLRAVEGHSPSSPQRCSSSVPLTPCPHKATLRHTVQGGHHSLVNRITRVKPTGLGTQTLR